MKNRKPSAATPERPPDKAGRWRLIVGGLFLAVVCFGGFGLVKAVTQPAPPASGVAPPVSSDAASLDDQSGPWGDLELSDIQIDPPDDYAGKVNFPTNHGTWFFGEGYDRARLLNLFASSDLTADQRTELTDPAGWEITPKAIRVTPEPRTVFKLSSSARSRIYRVLAEFRENFFQASPFMFPKDRVNDWFFHSGLTAETMSLISGLLYESGSMMCFSDVGIFEQIGSDAERLRLITALSRTPSVMVNLRISPGTDPEPLMNYWSCREDPRKVRPLIGSVARGRDGGSIDLSLLLPRFARDHVYTYPPVPEGGVVAGPDSLWSALNARGELPDYRDVDEAYLMKWLKENYEPVEKPARAGDLLVFANGSGRIVHACVYVAGDIVFTKNGASVFAPWALMRMRDVTGFYSERASSKILYFHRKSHVNR